MKPHRRFLALAAGIAALSCGILISGHDAWPQAARTIHVVVAVPASGPADIVAHLFAEQIVQSFGRRNGPMIDITTRTAADGALGAETVSHATPDGNTILMTTNAFIINPYVRRVSYDPVASFEPVCYLARSPQVIIVNSRSSYHTLADLLAAARAKPGDLTIASFGPAGSSHIAVEMLKLATAVNMQYVPFPSQLIAVNTLLDERVTSAFTSYIGVAEQLKAGKLRALATGSRARIELLPNVPTIAESGYKDYEAEVRIWLFAPAKTPKELISQLANWFTTAMQVPEVKAKLLERGLYPVGMCGADFGVYFRNAYAEYGRIIRDLE